MSYDNFAKKKKKKTVIYLVIGILVIACISGIVYFAWPKQPTNTKEQIQNLQSELNSVENKLNNLSDNIQKTELENKLTGIKNQIKNLSIQNNSPSQFTIKKLGQEIRKIKQKIENKDKPDNPNPNPNPQPDNNKGWNYTSAKINDNTYKYHLTLDGDEIDFGDFISVLRNNNLRKNFFPAFQGALKDSNSKFPAYFWKCPPVSKNTLGKPFEFVVIRSDNFNNVTQNYSRFQEHFEKSLDNWVVSFFSQSGNCLISPVPKGTADYINISQFTKNAPDEQQQALWKEVANSLKKELEKDADAPRWLNTEGAGVYYLHVRIDKKNGFYSNYPEYAKWE